MTQQNDKNKEKKQSLPIKKIETLIVILHQQTMRNYQLDISPLIIDSSSFELILKNFTVTVCGPRLALSFSRRLTSSASETRFLSMPLLAALMMEFSIPAAFSGLTVLIFITRCIAIYVFPWPQGSGFGPKWPVSVPPFICMNVHLLFLGLFGHLLFV